MIETILSNFLSMLSCEWHPTCSQVKILGMLIEFSNLHGYVCSTDYEDSFYEAVSQKLGSNLQSYQHILDVAFSCDIKLNYLLKTEIRTLLDSGDFVKYQSLLFNNGILCQGLLDAFRPMDRASVLKQFREAQKTDAQCRETMNAIFSRYCFNLFDKECTSLFFSHENRYAADYFEFLSEIYPDMCRRDKALAFVDVAAELFQNGYTDGCNIVLNTVRKMFYELNNHCDMAIYLPDIVLDHHSIQWELFENLVLYAEKLNPEKINKTYFRWKKIKSATESYIQSLKGVETDFSTAFQGFVFKDCFIIQREKNYVLLLIFEKNQRDERPLYCPACRSLDIEGNSYPILNVRSWECKNPLCPDRSKYNRGKRYSFLSVMRQKLMADELNRISELSIMKWHLDCVSDLDKSDAFEMVLRHYSCVGDGVLIYTVQPEFYTDQNTLGRSVKTMTYEKNCPDILNQFKSNVYFKRYIQVKLCSATTAVSWTCGNAIVYKGDALEVLKGVPTNTIDGAVTSPPYYNARNREIKSYMLKITRNGKIYIVIFTICIIYQRRCIVS